MRIDLESLGVWVVSRAVECDDLDRLAALLELDRLAARDWVKRVECVVRGRVCWPSLAERLTYDRSASGAVESAEFLGTADQ